MYKDASDTGLALVKYDIKKSKQKTGHKYVGHKHRCVLSKGST